MNTPAWCSLNPFLNCCNNSGWWNDGDSLGEGLRLHGSGQLLQVCGHCRKSSGNQRWAQVRLCQPLCCFIYAWEVCLHPGPARPVRQVRFWPYHFLVALQLVGMDYKAPGGVAPTWWRSIDVNVVHACSSNCEMASCSRFVVLELPHQLSTGFVFP